MASPQVENGYTKIANEIMGALCRVNIPPAARRCLDYIFRMTYGWNKKVTCLRNQDFVAATGLKKPNVCRSLKILEDMRIIVIRRDNRLGPTYCIQKDYSKWVIGSDNKKLLSVAITPVIGSDNSRRPQASDTNASRVPKEIKKEIITTKDNPETRVSGASLGNGKPKKEQKKKWAKSSPEWKLLVHCEEQIRINHPKIVLTPAQKSSSLEMFEKLMRIDGWEEDDIAQVIFWVCEQNVPRNGFCWADQFMSPLKLRKKDGQGTTYMAKWYHMWEKGDRKWAEFRVVR